jgi:hypothetical protein
MTLKEINARIGREVNPLVELVRGDGYHYFVLDDGKRFDTFSVAVPYTSRMSADRWVAEARSALAAMTAND